MVVDTTKNGFSAHESLDDALFPYVCERCKRTRGYGRWSQQFVNLYYEGSLEVLNRKHKYANEPYGHLHSVRRIPTRGEES